MGFGPARAVAAVANVLAGTFPLGWAGSPAEQSVALSPGRPIVSAWTSGTTVWRPAPARVSPTPARILRIDPSLGALDWARKTFGGKMSP